MDEDRDEARASTTAELRRCLRIDTSSSAGTQETWGASRLIVRWGGIEAIHWLSREQKVVDWLRGTDSISVSLAPMNAPHDVAVLMGDEPVMTGTKLTITRRYRKERSAFVISATDAIKEVHVRADDVMIFGDPRHAMGRCVRVDVVRIVPLERC